MTKRIPKNSTKFFKFNIKNQHHILILDISLGSLVSQMNYVHHLSWPLSTAKELLLVIRDTMEPNSTLIASMLDITETVVASHTSVVASRIRWSTLRLEGWTRDSQHTRGSWFSDYTCKRHPDRASGRTLRWFC